MVEPEVATEYRHPDGTTEVVYAVEGDHVLTLREYESLDDFADAVADAEDRGTHEGVASLPSPKSKVRSDDPEAVESGDCDADSSPQD